MRPTRTTKKGTEQLVLKSGFAAVPLSSEIRVLKTVHQAFSHCFIFSLLFFKHLINWKKTNNLAREESLCLLAQPF